MAHYLLFTERLVLLCLGDINLRSSAGSDAQGSILTHSHVIATRYMPRLRLILLIIPVLVSS